MKIWNTLVCVWIGVIHGAVLGNAELVLTSSPLIATDGGLFTLICSDSSGSLPNIAWLQNNTTNIVTQWGGSKCTKQPSSMGNNITRFRVSCSGTVHSIEFRFSSATDLGGWQCGKYVNFNKISPRSNIYSVGVASPVMTTQSSSTTTRYMGTTSEPGTVTPQKGEASPVMTTQSPSTTTRCMGTTSEPGTVTSQKGVASPVMTTQSPSTTTRYMGTTSEPGTVTSQKGVASSVMTTQSPSPTTSYMGTTSEPGTVTSQKGVASSVMTTQSPSPTTRYMRTTSEPGTVTSQKGVASHVMTTQSPSTTTSYMGTASEPGTVTSQKVSTDGSDSDTVYIAVGAVGGAALLAVVVVGIVCVRRRREATRVYFVENELYGRSRGIIPINEPEIQNDNIMSDAYASVDMPVKSTSTSREQGASCDADVDNLNAKPDKSKSSNVQLDIYTDVQKPKKKRQHDPKVSEDVNTGDVYAKPNKR